MLAILGTPLRCNVSACVNLGKLGDGDDFMRFSTPVIESRRPLHRCGGPFSSQPDPTAEPKREAAR
jgi:hypothetical protein